MRERVCGCGGMLVEGKKWIPEHPAEYNPNAGLNPMIGCNRLLCSKCGCRVRVFHGAHLPPMKQHDADIEALYDAEDAFSIEGVKRSSVGVTNLYACRCHTHTERAYNYAEDMDDMRPLRLPWRCEGHPTFERPGTLDGFTLPTSDDDLLEHIDDLLAAHLPETRHPAHAKLAGFQAARVYRLLESPESRAAFAQAVSKRLESKDVHVRRGALGFYQQEPRADGAQEVVRLRRRRSLWGVEDPVDSRVTLKFTQELALEAIERVSD